jgi:pilus assembly protein Flp/PilA
MSRRHHKEEHMTRIARLVDSLRRKDDGQDLLEYALLVALIALVAVAGVTAAGVRVGAIFNAIVTALPA